MQHRYRILAVLTLLLSMCPVRADRPPHRRPARVGL